MLNVKYSLSKIFRKISKSAEQELPKGSLLMTFKETKEEGGGLSSF